MKLLIIGKKCFYFYGRSIVWSICVCWHSQLRTGWFCLTHMNLLTALYAFGLGEDVIYTVSIPHGWKYKLNSVLHWSYFVILQVFLFSVSMMCTSYSWEICFYLHIDGGTVFIGICFVCRFFRMISQKPMQLSLPNVTYKFSTMNPENPFILRLRSQNSAGISLCTVVSAVFL